MSDDQASNPDGVAGRTAGASARALLAFTAIFGAGALGFALPLWGGRLALPHLATGIAVATLTRWGRGLWPAVAAAGIAINLAHHATPVQSAFVGAGLAAGAWLTARILERWRFDPTFAHYRDAPLFLAATVVGMVLPAAVGTLGFIVEPRPRDPGTLFGVLRWWSNSLAGVLLIGPLLIAARRASLEQLAARRVEALLYFSVFLAICAAALLLPPPGVDAQMLRPPLFVLSLAMLVITVMRLGFVVAASGALLLSVAVAGSFEFDRGLLHSLPLIAGLGALWSFVGAVSGVVLIVTALLAERDAAAAERLRAEHRYAEVFEASPQPLWVHDPATLRFLLVNQATGRQYGYDRAELLGMRASELAAPGEQRAVPGSDAAPRTGGEPFETRHVSRDGRVLDVELWDRPIEFDGRSAVLVFATDVTERKALGRAFIDAIAGEQRRIGQEMHDGLGQELTGVSLSMRALANRASRERLPVASDLDQLAALITACIQSARRIVHGLSPLAGADGNLVAALGLLAEHGSVGGIQVRLHSRLEAPLILPLEARNHLYRIAQEALQNAHKHSGARFIDIEFAVRTDSVRLAVIDDGEGSAAAATGSGLGMRTMRYRAAAIGGRLSVRSRHPSGTTVLCEAPQARATQNARSA
jgi:two-component system, NarL family, sensor histidine kinase DegS